MIDEKKLILHLNDWMLQESYLNQLKNPVDIISECIKVVQEQPKVGKWVPCSDRLPEKGQKVILQNYYGSMEMGIFGRDLLYQAGFYVGGDFFTANNYLAWQPLPEKYQEQVNNVGDDNG